MKALLRRRALSEENSGVDRAILPRLFVYGGGNEYREGREGSDVRPYDSTERANDYIRSYMKNHH